MNLDKVENYVGRPVCVAVMDHAVGARATAITRVYGELEEINSSHLLVRSWCPLDASFDADADLYALVRAAVLSVMLMEYID